LSGNGIYTVLSQLAAERLDVSLSKVTVEVGDSRLPAAPVAGGRLQYDGGTGSAVLKTCDTIRAKLFRAAFTANERWTAYGTLRR
jgi:xanthine dehydrogenase YagR molybdenum-binding subunit